MKLYLYTPNPTTSLILSPLIKPWHLLEDWLPTTGNGKLTSDPIFPHRNRANHLKLAREYWSVLSRGIQFDPLPSYRQPSEYITYLPFPRGNMQERDHKLPRLYQRQNYNTTLRIRNLIRQGIIHHKSYHILSVTYVCFNNGQLIAKFSRIKVMHKWPYYRCPFRKLPVV